jgi:hypothetical protein
LRKGIFKKFGCSPSNSDLLIIKPKCGNMGICEIIFIYLFIYFYKLKLLKFYF